MFAVLTFLVSQASTPPGGKHGQRLAKARRTDLALSLPARFRQAQLLPQDVSPEFRFGLLAAAQRLPPR